MTHRSGYDLPQVTNWLSFTPGRKQSAIVFGIAAPEVWNGLPLDVTSSQTLLTFKRKILGDASVMTVI